MSLYIAGSGQHSEVVQEIYDLQPWFKRLPDYCIVGIGDNEARKERYEGMRKGGRFATLIHPTAFVSESAEIGEGTVVCANAAVMPWARIGRNVIVNTGATVDHDCVVDDHAHIAPGVHLCGGVHVGEGALVGVGSCAVPGAKIKPWSLVKAGSVVK